VFYILARLKPKNNAMVLIFLINYSECTVKNDIPWAKIREIKFIVTIEVLVIIRKRVNAFIV
jgi:hypothetical protein